MWDIDATHVNSVVGLIDTAANAKLPKRGIATNTIKTIKIYLFGNGHASCLQD